MQGIDKTETWEDDAACVGVLSLTSKHPHAFDQAGGAWAMACAGLLGSMYGTTSTLSLTNSRGRESTTCVHTMLLVISSALTRN